MIGPHQKQAVGDTKFLHECYKANPKGEKPIWPSWKLPRCKTSGKIENIIQSPFYMTLEWDIWTTFLAARMGISLTEDF